MEGVAAIGDFAENKGVLPAIRAFSRRHIQDWSDTGRKYLDALRSGSVADKDLESGMKALIRFGIALHGLVSDPDYDDHHLAREIHGRLLQLQNAFRIVQQPLDDPETERLIKEADLDN